MKKIKFLPYRLQALYKVSFIILFFSLAGRPTYAESSDGKINDKSIQNQTTSGHSIELNGIGLAYSYEYAFSPRGTVLFSAGSSYTYGWMLGLDVNSLNEIYITTKDYHLISGNISVEPRFYYNLQKDTGKQTYFWKLRRIPIRKLGIFFSNSNHKWLGSCTYI